MATRVSWSLEEMIISLFMDETPLIGGSGHNPGGRGVGTGRTGAVRQVSLSRGDARGRAQRNDEHQENAGDVHVFACQTLIGGLRPPNPRYAVARGGPSPRSAPAGAPV